MTQQNSNQIPYILSIPEQSKSYLRSPPVTMIWSFQITQHSWKWTWEPLLPRNYEKWFSQTTRFKAFFKRKCLQQFLDIALIADSSTQIFLSMCSVIKTIQSCGWRNLSMIQYWIMAGGEEPVCKCSWQEEPYFSHYVLTKVLMPREGIR